MQKKKALRMKDVREHRKVKGIGKSLELQAIFLQPEVASDVNF